MASDSDVESESFLGSQPSLTRRGDQARPSARTRDANRKASKIAKEYAKRQYKPTLVVAPSSGAIVWKQAKRDFPASKIKFWMVNKASVKPKHLDLVEQTIRGEIEHLFHGHLANLIYVD